MINLSRKLVLSLLLFIIAISLAGCWDNVDVTQRALVVAVGLDKKGDNKIEFTTQVVKPNIIKQKGEGGGSEVVEEFSTTGDTVFEAVRKQLTLINRVPYYAHLHLIVIGEELAREGISDVLDLFERDHEISKTANVIIAKGMTAKEVIKTKSKMTDIYSLSIIETMDLNSKALARIKKITLIDILTQMGHEGQSIVIGVINNSTGNKEKQLEDMPIEGAGVFKKDKLVGWLSSTETKGLAFIMDEFKGGLMKVPNPINKDKNVTIEITRSKGKMDAKLIDGELRFSVEIKEEGNIADQQGGGDLTTQEMIKKLEEETEKAIEKEVRSAIDAAQKKYKSDIFGFGKIVHRKYLNYWRKVENNWGEEFSKIPVEIKVESKIRRTGRTKAQAKFE